MRLRLLLLLTFLLFVVVVGDVLSHNAHHHLLLQEVVPMSQLSNKWIARLADPSRLLVRKSDVNREGYVQRQLQPKFSGAAQVGMERR